MAYKTNAPRMTLFNVNGSRKYLTENERDRFLQAASKMDREVRTFSLVLAHTGCRLMEAVNLTSDRFDFDTKSITIKSLKKRNRVVYRSIPVSSELLDTIDLVHNLRQAKRPFRLWGWSGRTASRRIKDAMNEAGINGPQASAKGLRHCFGVTALQKNVPLNLLKKWLGHSSLDVTAIYGDAVGHEERELAKRMWE